MFSCFRYCTVMRVLLLFCRQGTEHSLVPG